MSRAEDIVDEIGLIDPLPVSAEYKAGATAAIGHWLGEIPTIECTYELGTAADDAWRLGANAAHRYALYAELLIADKERT